MIYHHHHKQSHTISPYTYLERLDLLLTVCVYNECGHIFNMQYPRSFITGVLRDTLASKILPIWLWSCSPAHFCTSCKQLKDTHWSVTGRDFPVCIFAFEQNTCAGEPKRFLSTVGSYDSPVQYITHSALIHLTLLLQCRARASLCVEKWWGHKGSDLKAFLNVSSTTDFIQNEGGISMMVHHTDPSYTESKAQTSSTWKSKQCQLSK